ncbi:MAG: hypothetical protein U5N27_05010 [Rhizobium sp.]|nr:hypothetical protein [Rhizobium sp.]
MKVDTAASTLFSGSRNLSGTRTVTQEFEAMLSTPLGEQYKYSPKN